MVLVKSQRPEKDGHQARINFWLRGEGRYACPNCCDTLKKEEKRQKKGGGGEAEAFSFKGREHGKSG